MSGTGTDGRKPEGVPFPEVRAAFRADPAALVGRVPGLFLVDKPEGMTSHDVVARFRRRLGLRRVGHGGTLDPMATGLLLLLAGNATRLFDELQPFAKTYVAELRLGERTDTQDRTGTVIATAPPEALPVAEERFLAALGAFRGPLLQTPPMYSALKKDGVPLHRLAREGKTVERDPRPVTVHELTCEAFDGTVARLHLCVSKGFYVRTLVDDLGAALGTGATLTALRRTRIGPYCVTDATPPDAPLGPDA